MNVKRLFIMLVLPFLALYADAQGKLVTGKVTDSKDGSPVAAATVTVKGTKTGTATASDGTFKLNVPDGATILIISSVGYNSQEVTIGTGQVNVSLVAITGNLNEVVAVGYSSVKKKDLTGSIVSVSSKDFVKGAVSTPEQLISGKVAGVSITSNGGAPGSGSVIRIRGGASLNASNDPLIVIDNVPVDNGSIAGAANPLSFINPNDIENITILKDASATAIYGSRASNGVIIITTKKGKAGNKLSVNLSTVASLYDRSGEVDVLSADEFRNAVNLVGNDQQKSFLGPANTNWQDVIYRTGLGTDNNLSLSGGIKKLPYRLSVGYFGQGGILKTSSYKRTSGGLSINPRFLHDKLKIDLNVKGTISESRFADEGAIGSAVFFDPTQPVYTYNNFGNYTINYDAGKPVSANPLALLEQKHNTSNSKRSIGNLQVDYLFMPGLHANVNAGYDVSTGKGDVITDADASFVYPNYGSVYHYVADKRMKLLEAFLKYEKDLSFLKSHFDILGGYGYQDWVYSSPYNKTYNLNGDSISPAAKDYPEFQQNTLVSFYGRANYSIADKYYITANARYDGSSRFSPENRWGFFPSVALMWRIKNEDFLRNSATVSDLKIRAGYGETGQQDGIGNYDYLPRLTISNGTAQYQFGDNYFNTFRSQGYDANRKWEQTATTNVAIDFGLFKGRITGTVEYFYKKTKDLLNNVKQAAGQNLTNFIVINVGNSESKGVELSLNVIPVQTKNFTWTLSGNATYNELKLTNLTQFPDPNYTGVPVGGIAGGVGNTIQRHVVGYAPYTFYVYKQVYDENGKPVEGLYEDLNGDGAIDSKDLYYYKSPAPKWFMGFSSSIEYKKWSFGFVARASLGNYMYNNFSSNSGSYRNITLPIGNRIQNVSSSVLETGFLNNQYFSDYYIENASFFRMDNINLSYNAGEISDGVNVKLTAFVQNAFIITKYSGLDPEIFGGIDNNIYPRPRIYSLGVNINF